MTFEELFTKAAGVAPYPYQIRVATGQSLPDALIAPTGAGKTAAVVLGWLYRRRFADESVRYETPRRLVLCFPMRTLVTQACGAIEGWLKRLGVALPLDAPPSRGGVGLHMLMGGAEADEWHLYPERDAILVGTQDMLLSRALNRGYGMSRFLWPWHFALLNSDSLWVFDEVQLMGVGLATGLQLGAFRQPPEARGFATYGPSHSLFMSATLTPEWLRTVDCPQPAEVEELRDNDLANAELHRRRTAAKRISKARSRIGSGCERALSREVLEKHQTGTRTIVVLNRVDRAVALLKEIKKAAPQEIAVLLHSRFRPPERRATLERALGPDFTGIVVSTQVIEAGVDVTSRTLFTELAPWCALVQRAGRCNRDGLARDADVIWIDHEDDEEAAPYEAQDLALARDAVGRLTSFNSEAIDASKVHLRAPEFSHVVRRRDILDLFDTTPDLAGNDIDVSRFIREGPERDALVFWRDLGGQRPNADKEPRTEHDELCPVPFLALREFAKRNSVWRWNPLDRAWEVTRERAIFPGGTYLISAGDGGYTTECGWDGKAVDRVRPLISPGGEGEAEEPTDGDPLTEIGRWMSLHDHSLDARRAAGHIVAALGLPALPGQVVVQAAHAHDLGKAHEEFQKTLRKAPSLPPGVNLWAKSDGKGARHDRRGLRHELASALAWLAAGADEERDLVAYLLAAHHGKVRLSLRALPHDAAPPEPGRLHARGIWDGERLPEVDIGEGLTFPETTLDLGPMRLGGTNGRPSWTRRVLALLDRFGPFRLAFLEALVRAADVRVSRPGPPVEHPQETRQ